MQLPLKPVTPLKNEKRIRMNYMMRDAFQSGMGTAVPAKCMVDANQNAPDAGYAMIQTCGGTFFQKFALRGRDEWKELETIMGFFKKKNICQSGLFRGDFLVALAKQPEPIQRKFILESARLGLNVIQNFHGLNDIEALKGVARGTQYVREERGYDIQALAGICVENNENLKMDNLLKFADQALKEGHSGFYIKSATGEIEPDFIYDLTGKLIDSFGPQHIDIHIHSTYGKAPAGLMAGISAAIERNAAIGIDVQSPALSGSVMHPSALKMMSLIKKHENIDIRANAPDINFEAIYEDLDALFDIRFQYRDLESKYDHDLIQFMRKARVAGGATSALKGVPGLVANVERVMKKHDMPTDWTSVQKMIYEVQEKILKRLGDPTQVTPYAFMTNVQAASAVEKYLKGDDLLCVLTPQIQGYLAGRYGRIPTTVDKDLQKKALKKLELKAPEAYASSIEDETLNAAVDKLKQRLVDAGIKDPTDRQIISASVLGQHKIQHIVNCERGRNKPEKEPELPDYAKTGLLLGKHYLTPQQNFFQAIGGAAKVEQFSQKALFLKQLYDGHQIFPKGTEKLREQWVLRLYDDVQQFMHDIPVKMASAGFREFENTNNEKAYLKRKFTEQCVIEPVLIDILDHRGTELFMFVKGLASRANMTQGNNLKFGEYKNNLE